MTFGRTAIDRGHALTHRIAAFLVGYPDEELRSMLPTLRTAAAECPARIGESLVTFIDELGSTPIMQAQQHYVETFDMRRRCSLYLTYWTAGDTRNRGQAMLEFTSLYQAAGVHPPEEELPDHLAVVLEFAATTDQRIGTALLLKHHPGLTLLSTALRKQKTHYVRVLDAVLATLPEPTEATMDEAARIAATGPPQETVGLAGGSDGTPSPYTSAPSNPTGARR